MKANKGLIIAIAAGVAVAGLAGYLISSEKGKKIRKKWKSRGAELAGEIDEMVSNARQRFSALKDELMKDCMKEQKREEQYQP